MPMEAPINKNHKENISTNLPSYENKVTNTPISLEQRYGQGFTILTKQGCDIKNKHEIHSLLEQKPFKDRKGIGYQGPPPLHQKKFLPTKQYKFHGTIKKGVLPTLHPLSETKRNLTTLQNLGYITVPIMHE